MKKKLCIFLTLLLLLGLLSGCGASEDLKEEVNIALSGSPVTIDPQLMSDTNAGFVGSFFTSCLYGYDVNKELVPVLAESYELSEDCLTYTFHLKKDLKWSDGRDLTAADCVFGFQRLADPDVGSNSMYLITDSCKIKNADDVTMGKIPVNQLGVSAPDALTFVVELEKPCPYFCALITMADFAPCNVDFYHSAGDAYATSEDTILSCGPYIMDRYEPLAMQIHFTKNPYYVNADAITVPGINLQVVANAQQGLMSYEAGGLDLTTVSGELTDLAEGDPELTEFPNASLFYLEMNQRSCPALQNRNIRMALSKSIDRDDFVTHVLKTGNTSVARVNPPGFYTDTDGSDFAGNADQYKEQAGYDPAKAKELWEQGLQEIGASSVTLNFMFASGNNTLMEALKDQMEKNLPGLTVELRASTSKEIMTARAKGGYDLLFSGWVADYADPTAFLALFISTGSAIGYNNPEYDALYEQIQSPEVSKDAAGRNELMHKAEDMLMDDAALIPLFSKGQTYLIRKGVTGFQVNPTGIGCILTGLRKEVK